MNPTAELFKLAKAAQPLDVLRGIIISKDGGTVVYYDKACFTFKDPAELDAFLNIPKTQQHQGN